MKFSSGRSSRYSASYLGISDCCDNTGFCLIYLCSVKILDRIVVVVHVQMRKLERPPAHNI
jgi:hypothetical protein